MMTAHWDHLGHTQDQVNEILRGWDLGIRICKDFPDDSKGEHHSLTQNLYSHWSYYTSSQFVIPYQMMSSLRIELISY